MMKKQQRSNKQTIKLRFNKKKFNNHSKTTKKNNKGLKKKFRIEEKLNT